MNKNPSLDSAIHFEILGEILRRFEDKHAHIVLDDHGMITTWNAPAEHLLGWTTAEVLGQSLADMVIPLPLRASHLAGLKRWQDIATTIVACKRLATTALRKDGKLISVHVDVQIVQDSLGTRFLGWVTPVEDVTENGH